MATNIATRCTEEEHAKVKAKADELGMTISEYVRFVSLHAVVEVKVSSAEKHCSLCNDGERQFDNCKLMHRDFLCKDKNMDGSVFAGKPSYCPNCGTRLDNA